MDKINIKDIDFSTLKRLKYQGATSTIYISDNKCFKILDQLHEKEKDEIYKKFFDMKGIKIDNVLLPKELIIKNDKLEGYSMDYFENSMPLSKKFKTRYIELKKLFDALIKTSNILKEIHKNGIICKDLSFENILIDKSGNVAFCDIDGCCYKNHVSPFISLLMKNFFIDYRYDEIILSDNLDRISMILSLYYLIYNKELQCLTEKQHHRLSNKINTFQNLIDYISILVDKNNPIGHIPYLDELIDTKDDFVYDRKKKLIIKSR